jgi:hypothetical protein
VVVHVALSEKEFRELVAGKIVEHKLPTGDLVKIILSDIGWDRMRKSIDEAESAQ